MQKRDYEEDNKEQYTSSVENVLPMPDNEEEEKSLENTDNSSSENLFSDLLPEKTSKFTNQFNNSFASQVGADDPTSRYYAQSDYMKSGIKIKKFKRECRCRNNFGSGICFLDS